MSLVKGKFQRIRRRQKLLGFLRLIRFPNLMILGVCQVVVGFHLVDNQWWNSGDNYFRFGLLVVVTIATAAGGYIINDYYDVKIDVLNKPKRVVVGRFISRRRSLVLHLFLVGCSISLSYFLNLKILATVTLLSVWLWLYSNLLKRQPLIGNISIALLTATAIYFPSVLFGPAKPELFLFCLFAFWISVIREIIKDMEDMQGDARHGCKTLPIVFGIPKTRMVIYIMGILLIISFIFGSFILPASWVVFALIPGGAVFKLLFDLSKADTSRHFHKLSFWCKLIMLGGIFSMVFI